MVKTTYKRLLVQSSGFKSLFIKTIEKNEPDLSLNYNVYLMIGLFDD